MKPISDIEVGLTYSSEKSYPRNFFVHLHKIPSDAKVHIEYDGKEISATDVDSQGDSDARFHVLPDKEVKVTVLQGETIIGAGTYLIHNDKIFVQAISNGPGIQLIQTVQSFGKL
jgi:hypothetical protein